MRLIDAFELMRSMGFHDDCANCDCDKLECEYDRIYTKSDICDFVEYHIFNAPVVDAVEVVRCKDCKWHEGYHFCTNLDVIGFEGNDYCSMGERREDGSEAHEG